MVMLSIPMLSLMFSFFNILTSAIQINIFIVYIGQFRTLESIRRFVDLALGHLPFFIHSVLSRILAISIIFVYLDLWGFIPLAAIFAANLLIGYLKLGDQRFSADVRHHLRRRVKSRLLKEGNYNADVPTGSMKDKNLDHQLRANTANSDVPVWLNSFLGVFVPACYMAAVDPRVLNAADPAIRAEVGRQQATFQKSLIRYQVESATAILLIAVSAVAYLVNMTEYRYSTSCLANTDFNIICGLILVQSFMSMVFLLLDIDILATYNSSSTNVREEDIVVNVSSPDSDSESDLEKRTSTTNKNNAAKVFKTRVEQTRRRRQVPCGLLGKLAVTALAILVVLVPLGLAYLCSVFLGNPTAYVVTKNETSSEELVILAFRSQVLNRFAASSSSSGDVIHGRAVVCNETTKELAATFFSLSTAARNSSQVLKIHVPMVLHLLYSVHREN